MRRARVGVVGHWRANIGHDLMALGVERILRKAIGGDHISHRIEQHRPLDIYPWWMPLRHVPWLRHGRGGGLARRAKDLLNRPDISRRLWPSSWVGSLDLAIVCGGPLIRPGLAEGDLGLMYQHVHGAFASNAVPLLDVSVGSAYPWETKKEASLVSTDAAFLERMLSYSTVTTVRDALAQDLFRALGHELPLIADTGFVAGASLAAMRPRDEGRYVVLNAQRYGANEDWGQGVDPERWLATLSDLARRLDARREIVMVCHSELEMRLAQRIAPAARRIRPRTVDDYAEIVSGAVAGICTRIHSGIALAGVGVPVIGVGTDSRLGTLETLGLTCHYVKDVDADLLEAELERTIGCAAVERERLLELRSAAEAAYAHLVRSARSQ